MMEQAMPVRNRNVIPKPGKSRAPALTITHPNAAGIDIGSASHFVAVPPDRDDQPVREFPSFVSEIGVDMTRFPTIKHFTSWLGLCPGTKITGGKVMSGKTKRCVNRAARPCA